MRGSLRDGIPQKGMFRRVPNFVDVSRYQRSYSPGTRIGYFGLLSREKGLCRLMQAVAASNTSIAIADKGPARASLKLSATRLGAKVEFPGLLTGEKLHYFVGNAHAVVFPSKWYENASVSALEAYALGRLVMGARIGGIPELIQEEVTGLLFDSGNIKRLAETMLRVCRTSDLALKEMGRQCRKWVEEAFTADVYRGRILGVYRELGVEAASKS